MLNQINIKNFAIIEKMSIDFEPGMSVITGQTGAGKSIVVDAINQLLGARATKAMVSDNQEYASIEGVFDLTKEIEEYLITNDFDIEDDYLVINKKIKKDGKSQLRLNNTIVTNDFIKNLGNKLVEIHSQQSNIAFNESNTQQEYVDSFFNAKELKVLEQYQENYSLYLKLLKQKEELFKTAVDPELLPFYQDQLKEIENNILSEEELEELNSKEEYYKNYEKISSSLQEVVAALENNNVLNGLYDADYSLKKISDYSVQISEYSDKLESIYFELSEVTTNLKDEYYSLNFDQDDYEIIKDKLFNYQKMIKKYSYSIEEVIAKKEDLEAKIEFINNSDKLVEQLDNNIKNQEQQLTTLALQLDEIRSKYIKNIEKEITKILKDLYLKEAKFAIELEKTKGFSSIGQSKVQFLFSANKGSSLKAMNQVASGGEMARLILALKVIEASHDSRMYIFDEIDTGVSGEVADAIGRKVKELAKSNDVIIITHLPQVAVYANHHIYISKASSKSFTTSNCQYLDAKQTIDQIASMLSGGKVSDAAIENAKNLIESAKNNG